MRRFRFILMAVTAVGFISCMKDNSIPQINDNNNDNNNVKTVTFNFNIKKQGHPYTKSIDIGTYSDDEIERLDIYIYGDDSNLLNHIVLKGAELQEPHYTESAPEDSERGYLFIANLNEVCAEYLEQFDVIQLTRYEGCYIPLSVNHKPNKPVMGGTAMIYFTSDQEITVDLYRYCYRIEVGNITANFEDEGLKNKEIQIKRIVLTNSYNIFPLVVSDFPYGGGKPSTLFGPFITFTYELFGGGKEGYMAGYDVRDSNGKYMLTGDIIPEELSGEFSYVLNDNCYVEEKGTLTVDATGSLYDATVCEFNTDAGEGVIYSSANGSGSNSMAVNKTFYGIYGRSYSYKTTIYDMDDQDSATKLVIEALIDGTTYFYPIQIIYPQPNTIYHIHNITLTGYGSRYSNFYFPEDRLSTATRSSGRSNYTVEYISAADKKSFN